MPASLSESKRRLRQEIRRRFSSLDSIVRSRESAALLDRVEALPGYLAAGTLLLYVGHLPEEPPTLGLIDAAILRGQRVVCPRVCGKDRLGLFEIGDASTDLEPGVLGIPEPLLGLREVEPSEIDWVLVPGLAFDERCNRLGRGVGHYDRLLVLIRPEAPRWAAVYTVQVVDDVPVEEHDQPVDGVLTASRSWMRARS